jgi:hypothetical protein
MASMMGAEAAGGSRVDESILPVVQAPCLREAPRGQIVFPAFVAQKAVGCKKQDPARVLTPSWNVPERNIARDSVIQYV